MLKQTRLYKLISDTNNTIKEYNNTIDKFISFVRNNNMTDISYHGCVFLVQRHYVSDNNIPLNQLLTNNHIDTISILPPEKVYLNNTPVTIQEDIKHQTIQYNIYYEGHYEPNLYTGWFHFVPHTLNKITSLYGSIYPKKGNIQPRDILLLGLFTRINKNDDPFLIDKQITKAINKQELKKKLKYYHYFKKELDDIGTDMFLSMKIITLCEHLKVLKHKKDVFFNNKSRFVIFPTYHSVKNLKNKTDKRIITFNSFCQDTPYQIPIENIINSKNLFAKQKPVTNQYMSVSFEL